MKKLIVAIAAMVLAVSAVAQVKIAPSYTGNFNAADGSNRWEIGIFAEQNLVIYQDDFWDIKSADRKGLTIENRDTKALTTISYVWLKTLAKKPVYKAEYQIPTAEDKPFGDNLVYHGKALIRGFIDGYNAEMDFKTFNVLSNNIATRADRQYAVDIAPDGTFEVEIDLSNPDMINGGMGKTYFNLYLEQGDTLMVYLNYADNMAKRELGKQYAPSDKFMGKAARINQEIVKSHDVVIELNYFGLMDWAVDFTADEYKEHILGHMKANAANVEKYIATHAISQKGAKIMRENHLLNNINYIVDYNNMRRSASYQRKDTTIQQVPLPIEYFDIVKQIPLNDPQIVVLPQADQFLQAIYYCTPFYRDWDTRTTRDLVGYIEKNQLLTPEQTAEVKAQGSSEKMWDFIQTNHPWVSVWMTIPEMAEIISVQGKKHFGDSAAFVNELLISRETSSILERQLEFVPNWAMAQLLRYFTQPYYITSRLNANDKFRPVPVSVGAYKPTTKAEILLDSLLKPLRGNVVYLDFWAIWCGPCRAGMQNSYKIKEELKGLPVAFAYLSSLGDTPKEKADEFFTDNNITGTRIEITNDEWNLLTAQWNIAGIPRYMIIGKDGSMIAPDANSHDVELLRKLAQE